MFQRILMWLREVINKMIGQSSLKQALNVDVAVSADMANALQSWSNMYINQASWLSNDIRSLNLPAAIAAEIARGVTIEMELDLSGSPRAAFLAGQLETVLPKMRQFVEYGAAKGGLVFKPYVRGDMIALDCVQADQFYPVAFDANGNMTSCVFSDQRTIGQAIYTRLEFHEMGEMSCRIVNRAFKSSARDQLGSEVSLDSVPAWAEILPEATITNVARPLFAYFRFPLANNIDPASPLGVSCYARAVDLIEQADRLWSDLLWEFDSGKRALYADVDAFDKDPTTGLPLLPNKRLYRTLHSMSQIGKGEELFKEWSPTLREQNIINGLNAILRKVEFNTGLAYGTLSDPNQETLTATEIKSAKQRSFATIRDTQKALQGALDGLLYAMDVWATLYRLAPVGSYTATYHWDDSILTDDTIQFAQDQQTVTMSAMPKWMFLVRNYDLSEADARKWVDEARGESAATADLFGLPAGGGGAGDRQDDEPGNGDKQPVNEQGDQGE